MRGVGTARRLRWMMIALVFFATTINYLDRQVLSVAEPVLQARFHFSDVAYGQILFAFMLAYTIMNGVSGLVIDRLGTRVGYALFVGWWSLSELLHVFARGALSLGVFRFLLGMGEAGNWPGAVKVVAEWFPAEERSLASGIFNSGSSVGAILAPPIVAVLLLKFGWQSAFLAVGCFGFLWLAAWLVFYRPPERAAGEPLPPSPPLAVLVRTRFVWSFTLSKIFMDPVWYFYVFWFPNYLDHARHFNMAAIGRYAWIPYLVAGLGSAGGGLIAKVFFNCGMNTTGARKSAVTVASLMMTMAIPAVLVGSAAVSIGFVAVAMAGYTAGLASMLAMPADVFAAEACASVYGLASMGAGFGGMVFMLLTGWMIERYSYLPVFVMFGLIPLVCVGVLWTLVGPLEPTAYSNG